MIKSDNITFILFFFIINFCEFVDYVMMINNNNIIIYFIGLYNVLLLLIGLSALLFWWSYTCNSKNPNLIIDIMYTEYNFTKKKLSNGQYECTICYCEYDNTNPKYYLFECGHHGHADCIDGWWKNCGRKKCYASYCKYF